VSKKLQFATGFSYSGKSPKTLASSTPQPVSKELQPQQQNCWGFFTPFVRMSLFSRPDASLVHGDGLNDGREFRKDIWLVLLDIPSD